MKISDEMGRNLTKAEWFGIMGVMEEVSILTSPLIKRRSYLDKLMKLKDVDLIKVISGVRRSGKSSLLELFRAELRETGVSNSQIQAYNFEEEKNFNLTDWRALHRKIEEKLVDKAMNYVFLDEVQLVQGFERLVDSLYVKKNVDLYITGSNAYFLASEWATLLSGRYIEISILPFSFKEYLEATFEAGKSRETLFGDYLRNGGFPGSVGLFKVNAGLGVEYLSGIYNTVIVKDVLTRAGVSDPGLLENLMKFSFDNISNLTSPNRIADYMRANYRAVSGRTIENYLKMAEESFILYGVDRFDIKGRELLQTQQKKYLVDTGLRQVLLGRDQNVDVGRMLENVVFLELKRRGYRVWTGKTKAGKEVDFVARSLEGQLEYYQVTETMRGEETRKRELSALENIDDNYLKVVLSLDPEENNYGGIIQRNVVSWLVE